MDSETRGLSNSKQTYPNNVSSRLFASNSFKVDEGYSEDPFRQTGSEVEAEVEQSASNVDQDSTQIDAVRHWLFSQPLDLRIALARELLQSIPNTNLSELVKEANQRLHFDPVICFPQELISNIFEYCDPQSLFHSSLVSKNWRERACDPRLWRRLYALEGWTHNADNLRTLERKAQLQASRQGSSQQAVEKLRSISRPSFDGQIDLPDILLDIPTSEDSKRILEEDGDSVMQDMTTENTPTPSNVNSPRSSYTESNLAPFVMDEPFAQEPKFNWQYVYNQRRRLEKNWFGGKFTNFRLPHPDFQDEAHTQCVYTIQYSAKHLVSGSRDKSVRVWDLETGRLKFPPLQGHEGSVLCLQFDEKPSEDVIISGGSDSDLIVWKFSTGELIKKMKRAHRESVLNLRFDDRYLVTCSKDKTIQVWNRKAIKPGDADYPVRNPTGNATYPDYILNPQSPTDPWFPSSPSSAGKSLEPYTLLMTFEGHGAAVNAIQILADEIVSASGDRKIILWNIKTGNMIRSFPGHTKGIACVQYDGRRIVSGSSDNTVRIFDSTTSAELATIEGHRDLVRTVQADFGDGEEADIELEARARESDRKIAEGEMKSTTPYFVKGAKLPPGGGGNRWSKIVSGSYDETVIIWRRDKDGRWYIAKELRQEDALRTSSGNIGPRARPSQANLVQQRPTGQNPWTAAPLNNATLPLVVPPQNPTAGRQPITVDAAARANAQSAAQAARANAWRLLHNQGPPVEVGVSSDDVVAPITSQTTDTNSLPPHLIGHPALAQSASATAWNASLPSTDSPGQAPPVVPATGPPAPHHHAQAAAAAAAAAAVAAQAGPNNRVFKLQFDARRIICCSQEPVIVGWDFAAGDEEIIQASRFFAEPC